MLTPEFYEKTPNDLSRLINKMQNWTLQQIAARINRLNKLNASSDYQLMRLAEIQEFDNDLKAQIAEMTGKSFAEIERIFEQAVIETNLSDKHLFNIARIPYVPYHENAFLQQITRAMAEQTKSEFTNLTRSIGFKTYEGDYLPARDYFIRKLDEVTTQVSTGVSDYNSAIRRVVNEMVGSGIRTVEYPGRTIRIESAVRAAVLTGVSQLADKVTWKNIEDLGVEIVETTAHGTARDTHIPWQGRRFALNGTVDEVLSKVDAIRAVK